MRPNSYHDFNERLQFSQTASEEEFWKTALCKAFPDATTIVPLNGDTPSQRQGKDWAIHLSGGYAVYIDTKTREHVFIQENGRTVMRDDLPQNQWKDCLDILLEFVSVDRTGKPGWMEDPTKRIDYFGYAWLPLRLAVVLPWLPLKRAYNKHRDEWLEKYRCSNHRAQNKTYQTLFVPVPVPVVLDAVRQAFVVRL